jgi:hypothetical protein
VIISPLFSTGYSTTTPTVSAANSVYDKLELGRNVDLAFNFSSLRAGSMEADKAYFSSRATEERIAAMKARHRGARQAHLELARRYDDFVSANIIQDRYFAFDLLDGPTAA